MAESILSKRIHVSGLTPTISYDNLRKRFETFGIVNAVDGVGLLDGNGHPRKFAYVTLNTTQAEYARCLNVLSGSTWKGAKLRIGEAKPDWHDRLELERNQPPKSKVDAEPSRLSKRDKLLRALKKRRSNMYRQRESGNMDPVTADNVDKRKGWKKTPLGHLIRPLRMRPLHPLPSLAAKAKSKAKISAAKGKQKERPLLSRSFRTIIDPTRYGAVHILGSSGMLGEEVAEGGSRGGLWEYEGGETWVRGDEGTAEKRETIRRVQKDPKTDVVLESNKRKRVVTDEKGDVALHPSHIPLPPSQRPQAPRELDNVDAIMKEERAQALGLLENLFQKGEAPQWDSDDEDLGFDLSHNGKPDKENVHDENLLQVVPVEDSHNDTTMDEDTESPQPSSRSAVKPMEAQTAASTKNVHVDSLKSMFAPREEEVGFSLMSNLVASGLDVELEEVVGPSAPTRPDTYTADAAVSPLIAVPLIQDASFDPSPRLPLFFPLEEKDRDKSRKGGKARDIFDVAQERGWGLDSFWRNETEEEIRKRWDEVKGDLTREYKRRHREAVKRKRRGHGVDIDGE